MHEYLTPAKYAELRGVSRMAISKAINDGRISQALKPKGKRFMVHVRVADWEYTGDGETPSDEELADIAAPWPATNKRRDQKAPPKKKPKRKPKEKPKAKASSPETPPASRVPAGRLVEGLPSPPANSPSLAQSRAKREQYLAQLAQLDYEEKVGERIPAGVVEQERFSHGRTIRDAILNIPNRVGPALAAALGIDVDAHTVAVTMEAELRDILQDLVDGNIRTSETSDSA